MGKLIHALVIGPPSLRLACKSRKSSMPSMASAWPCVTSRASMLLTPYFGNVCNAACGRQTPAMSFLQRSGDDRNNKTIHDHTQPYSEIHPMYTAESMSNLQNVVRRSCINLEVPAPPLFCGFCAHRKQSEEMDAPGGGSSLRPPSHGAPGFVSNSAGVSAMIFTEPSVAAAPDFHLEGCTAPATIHSNVDSSKLHSDALPVVNSASTKIG